MNRQELHITYFLKLERQSDRIRKIGYVFIEGGRKEWFIELYESEVATYVCEICSDHSGVAWRFDSKRDAVLFAEDRVSEIGQYCLGYSGVS